MSDKVHKHLATVNENKNLKKKLCHGFSSPDGKGCADVIQAAGTHEKMFYKIWTNSSAKLKQFVGVTEKSLWNIRKIK